MPLFGPLSSVRYANAPFSVSSGLFDVDQDAADYAMQFGVPRPIFAPRAPLLPMNAAAAAASNAGVPAPVSPAGVTPPAGAPPPLASLGTFTTRRTQLFGPLSTISI
ncbi:MAG TPA: hypothetical protein VLW54_09910 [Candidatus Acidoferrales bacterium]|nr:hypothetical protein [Candidatus Acidoferrales bacterium]